MKGLEAAEDCRRLLGPLDVKWGDVFRFASGRGDVPGNGGAGRSGVFRTIAFTLRDGNRSTPLLHPVRRERRDIEAHLEKREQI